MSESGRYPRQLQGFPTPGLANYQATGGPLVLLWSAREHQLRYSQKFRQSLVNLLEGYASKRLLKLLNKTAYWLHSFVNWSSVPCIVHQIPRDCGAGSLPDFDEFSGSVDAIRGENPWWGTLKAAQEQPAETLQPGVNGNLSKVSEQPAAGQTGMFKNLIEWREKYILESSQESLLRKQGGGDLEEVEVIGKYIIKGGATGASNVLDAYLRFLEPTSKADWQAWDISYKLLVKCAYLYQLCCFIIQSRNDNKKWLRFYCASSPHIHLLFALLLWSISKCL